MAEEQQKQVQNVRKPVLVKIIAVISILFGFSMMLAFLLFLSPLQDVRGSELKDIISREVIKITMGIALLIGGFGLLKMKKWGLYTFSIGALIMLINAFSGIGSLEATRSLLGAEFFISAFILTTFPIIYGIASLVYLWRTKKNFA